MLPPEQEFFLYRGLCVDYSNIIIALVGTARLWLRNCETYLNWISDRHNNRYLSAEFPDLDSRVWVFVIP